ncbi:GLIPR1-like protein 1 [Babylonia areolata]|uniref:GLIPR1-like protein 1 n=1 Tax=Babylonia areolata TaxID=304850 RepID=UPI003FD68EF0
MRKKACVWVLALWVVLMGVQTAVSFTSADDQQHGLAMAGPEARHEASLSSPSERAGRHRRAADYSNRDVSGYSEEQKKLIVDKHNALRAAQGSSDMMYMYWDNDLEKLAQSWVENCNFKHSSRSMRSDVGQFSYVGENLYASTGTYDPDVLIQAWYDEIHDYEYTSNHCSPNKECGHYTQLVWARSYAVGCGVRYCPVLRNTFFPRGFIVSCNYGPGGNYRGESPFEIGNRCSACDKDAPYCVKGLCARVPVVGTSDAASRDLSWRLLIGCAFMSAMLSSRMLTWVLTPAN